MISATALGLKADSSIKAEGPAIVIRDQHQNPIVLVVEVAPGLQQVFTVDRDTEFRRALQQYGVAAPQKVDTFRM